MKCSALRHPRTTQELRRNCDDNERQFTRGKRRRKLLPNSYWDIFKKDNGRDWKSKRKTQYYGT